MPSYIIFDELTDQGIKASRTHLGEWRQALKPWERGEAK
jgi:hypothetical protein